RAGAECDEDPRESRCTQHPPTLTRTYARWPTAWVDRDPFEPARRSVVLSASARAAFLSRAPTSRRLRVGRLRVAFRGAALLAFAEVVGILVAAVGALPRRDLGVGVGFCFRVRVGLRLRIGVGVGLLLLVGTDDLVDGRLRR